MPRSKDEVDKVSLGAHRLLHRSCRGKAHGSGIAKQNNCRIACSLSSRKSPRSPVRDPAKQQESCVSGNAVPGRLDRKHSRNSTSSWECSDSDSMHSSEIGQNGCPVTAENRSLSISSSRSFADRVRSDAKEKIKRSHGGNYCSSLLRGSKNFKKESWADTLRVGCIDDRIKRMEAGWDDSNVIRTPKERKWHRITAEIEQRIPNPDNGLRMFNGFKNGWAGNPKKMSKRSRACHQRCSKPIQDIIEWEELVELALARKIRRKIRGEGKTNESGVMESVKGGEESGRVKDGGECMKRLEVLLENRMPPQTDEVCFAKDSGLAGSLVFRLLPESTSQTPFPSQWKIILE